MANRCLDRAFTRVLDTDEHEGVDMAQTDIQTMLAVSAKVDGLRGEIHDLLSALRGDVNHAASGIWQGSASTTFAQVMTNWDSSANKLENALSGIGESIKTSGVQYDQSEQDNTSQLNSVASSLNL
jgi:WXG100 family type VII secretion target